MTILRRIFGYIGGVCDQNKCLFFHVPTETPYPTEIHVYLLRVGSRRGGVHGRDAESAGSGGGRAWACDYPINESSEAC